MLITMELGSEIVEKFSKVYSCLQKLNIFKLEYKYLHDDDKVQPYLQTVAKRRYELLSDHSHRISLLSCPDYISAIGSCLFMHSL